MGPRSGERGKSANGHLPRRRNCSFNGAALRRARKEGVVSEIVTLKIKLQWGRAQASAERLLIRRSWRSSSSFNGAALRRARKAELDPRRNLCRCCFNGAALRRARKALCCRPFLFSDASGILRAPAPSAGRPTDPKGQPRANCFQPKTRAVSLEARSTSPLAQRTPVKERAPSARQTT